MPLIPQNLPEIKQQMRSVLESLPVSITDKELSIATQGRLQSAQISAFRNKGYLSDENLPLLESALESFNLWPPADLKV